MTKAIILMLKINLIFDIIIYKTKGKEQFMENFIVRAASLVGEMMTKLQCDGSSGYACGGGATV